VVVTIYASQIAIIGHKKRNHLFVAMWHISPIKTVPQKLKICNKIYKRNKKEIKIA